MDKSPSHQDIPLSVPGLEIIPVKLVLSASMTNCVRSPGSLGKIEITPSAHPHRHKVCLKAGKL